MARTRVAAVAVRNKMLKDARAAKDARATKDVGVNTRSRRQQTGDKVSKFLLYTFQPNLSLKKECTG